MIRFLLFLSIFFFALPASYGEDIINDEIEIEHEPLPAARDWKEQNFQKYLNQKAFNYHRVLPPEASLFQRLRHWLFDWLEDFMQPGVINKTWAIFKMVFTALMIYLFFRHLFKLEGFSGVFRKKNPNMINSKVTTEDIHQEDLEGKYQLALKQSDFRSALRYRFLLSLRNLNDKNLIEWTAEKTNRDFYYEIKSAELQSAFQKLTYWFDHTWYGGFSMDQELYEWVDSDFVHFQQKLASN